MDKTVTAPGTWRWWVYQRERFPLLRMGPLLAAYSATAVSYSAFLRDPQALPRADSLLVAFFSLLIFTLQLRIADEFKDVEDDTRYRPYRPVPRGLVSLRELRALLVLVAAVQLTMALWMSPVLAILLVVVWGYMGLMTKEFFASDWLRRHPLHYLWTHQVIMPLTGLYMLACDFVPAGALPQHGAWWFLPLSLCLGLSWELSRKIRAPGDEEAGVLTYSGMWGPGTAAGVWLAATSLAAVFAALAARQLGAALLTGVVLLVLWTSAALAALRYARQPLRARARWIPTMSALWTLGVCLGLAVACWGGKLTSLPSAATKGEGKVSLDMLPPFACGPERSSASRIEPALLSSSQTQSEIGLGTPSPTVSSRGAQILRVSGMEG